MSSAGAKLSDSVEEFVEQFKDFEMSFQKRGEAALYFAGKGIPIFPLHTVRNGKCTCQKGETCKSPGKHPLYKNWKYEATTDSGKIKRVFLANPDANVGLTMGGGLVGIDIDVKNGKNGWVEWQKILEQHQSDQVISLIQVTPSGGLHIILKVRDSSVIPGNSDAIAKGIDIRSDGNLLVGGGSENDRGGYRTFDTAIAQCPDWLESLMIERSNWVKPMMKRLQTGAVFKEGERNKACLAFVVLLNGRGCTKEEFGKELTEFALTRCTPPYEDGSVDYMKEHYWNPRNRSQADVPNFNDLGKPDFKIWEVSDKKVRVAFTVFYEYVSQGQEEAYELAKRNLPNMLMQYLKHNFHVTREIVSDKLGDTLFWFSGKFYESEPTNSALREKLEHLTFNYISGSEKNEVITKLMDNAYKKEQQERYLALYNGLLDCEELRFLDFTPDIFATVYLPVEFNGDAKHPILDKFLSEVVDENAIPRLQEWAGYTLIPGYPIKKGFIAIGPTDSGKSTFLLTLKEVLGNNVSSATFQQLSRTDARFVTSKLYKKLANIAPDMPTNSLSDLSIFKGITGRDLIPGEFKYKHPFDFQPMSKLMFSANSLPPVREDDEAFFNRWDIVVFHEPPWLDPTLQERLRTERSGILNWMIEGAKRIVQNGVRFSNSTPTAEAMQIWEIASNPIRAFYNRCIAKEGEEEIPAPDFYAAYKDFAGTNHAKIVGEDVFDQQFSKISKTQIITRQRNNVRIRFRKGLKIRPEGEWLNSSMVDSQDNHKHDFEPEKIFEVVRRNFANLSKTARERDNIERWISSEYDISMETAQSFIEDWFSKGLVTLNGKCLEFSEDGGQDA